MKRVQLEQADQWEKMRIILVLHPLCYSLVYLNILKQVSYFKHLSYTGAERTLQQWGNVGMSLFNYANVRVVKSNVYCFTYEVPPNLNFTKYVPACSCNFLLQLRPLQSGLYFTMTVKSAELFFSRNELPVDVH